MSKHTFQNLCGSCMHKPCCTECISPLVFSQDIFNLEKIGKNYSEYVDDITIKGSDVKTIKKKNNSSECIFWDNKNKKCSIYENRPFDCKMFPFDIIYKDEKFFWIVFNCNPNSTWDWTDSYLNSLESDPAFSEFFRNVYLYASLQMADFAGKKTDYTVIRQVRLPTQLTPTSKTINKSPI